MANDPRQMARQINDLKRQNRDLWLEMMELQERLESGGGGGGGVDPAQFAAAERHIKQLEHALQQAHHQLKSGGGGGGADPRQLQALQQENQNLKIQILQMRETGADRAAIARIRELEHALQHAERRAAAAPQAAPGGGGMAERAVYDRIIGVLGHSLKELERARDHAPQGSGGGGGNAEAMRELERENRRLERELSRAQEAAASGGGRGRDDARVGQLQQELERAQQEIMQLQAGGGGGRGEMARQLNALKRENRDLRLELESGGGGGGADPAQLAAAQRQIKQLEQQLARARQGGGGGGGTSGEARQALTATNDFMSQYRGDMRTVNDYLFELRKFVDVILSIDRGALDSGDRRRLNEAFRDSDPEVILNEITDMTKRHEESVNGIREQLRSLRD